jgi:hypothetical protein
MKCPTCGENTPDAWKSLYVTGGGIDALASPKHHKISVDWMYCAAKGCGQLVVRAHDSCPKSNTVYEDGSWADLTTDTWYVWPRHSSRPLDPLVVDKEPDLARDYAEATTILDISHRMSSVLARSILADLLEKHAGQDAYGLRERIDGFAADKEHPRRLRDNLHHFREIADFGAHTQKNDQFERLEISREEADWTLSLVERLFDYFIVDPEKDRRLREGMDAKIAQAGRKPVTLEEGDGEQKTTADREDPEGA